MSVRQLIKWQQVEISSGEGGIGDYLFITLASLVDELGITPDNVNSDGGNVSMSEASYGDSILLYVCICQAPVGSQMLCRNGMSSHLRESTFICNRRSHQAYVLYKRQC